VTLFTDLTRSPKRQHASQAAGFAAVTIAATVLIGWWAGLPPLSSWGSGFPAMTPLGALGLAALGLALIHPGRDSRVLFGAGIVVAVFAALVLGLVLFNFDLRRINSWLAPWAAAPGLGAAPFRVGSAAAVAFGLAGGSLALSCFERRRLAAIMLGGIAGAIAIFAMLGYLKGIDTLYGSMSVNSPPMPTAMGLLCVASGIVSRIGTMLRDSERQLHASKARLQVAIDAAQLGSWQYDPLYRVASWDTRFKEIFGVAENRAIVEEVMRWVHPDDAEKVWAAFQVPLDRIDHPKPFAVEYRIWRGDGEVRWVEAHGLAYFEGTARERPIASVVGTVADITERKEREEKVHLLMREVNHRAKNMLSVVDSIAHQTATRNPEDFIERFSERIQALSANQDLLIRSDWSGVDIADLTRAQLAHFADLIGSRIVVDGPKLRLKPASAQAIGLALHELATNAGKYGALSTDKGHVYVSWGIVDGTFTMSWTERDGPPVLAPKRCGFGTIVMEAMAARSVNGKVQIDYAPSGLTWRLACLPTGTLESRAGAA
jgi:PAS domain S-box-containing protein